MNELGCDAGHCDERRRAGNRREVEFPVRSHIPRIVLDGLEAGGHCSYLYTARAVMHELTRCEVTSPFPLSVVH